MIAKGKTGRGFKGTALYLLHDKRALTSARVAWTHTENLRSDSPERAWREMVWAAIHAEALKRESGQARSGRKAELPVYHLSLSWAKDEAPEREAMIGAARQALEALGLEKHQTLIVCHRDEPQPHVHILVNRVDHETGVMNRLSRSNRKLSAWALAYEQAQGHIRCEQRLESNQALTHGQKPRHTDAAIREAWERSDSGRAFQQALAAHGYTLACGNKRIVVVDPHGKAINPARQLRGVKAADIAARLADLDRAALPTVEQVRGQQEAARAAERQRERERAAAQEAADATALREAFARAAGQREVSAAQSGDGARAQEPPATFDREAENARWEQAVMDGAIAREQSREAREQFAKAAGEPETGRGTADGDGGLTPNEQRAALQSRHLYELIDFDREQDPKRIRHEERMRAFYNTDAERQELRALERKRWLFRSGRERMEELRLSIEESVRCEHEAMREFDYGIARERDKIVARQAREREDLDLSLRDHPLDHSREHESERAREARERMERAEREREQGHIRRQRRGWE